MFFTFLMLMTALTLPASAEKKLDLLLEKNYQKHDLTPVAPAEDSVFLRRAMLNATGKLPTAAEVLDFCGSKDPEKHRKLIGKLVHSPHYADMMAMRYADMFRIKSEFPINLWPNAVQSYHRYFRDAALNNTPWNRICRELLTCSGSNFRVAPANFFRASAQRTPDGLAKITALSLMGIRVEKMDPDDRKDFALFFSRIRFKSTDEWKEEIVYNDPQEITFTARTPDGKKFRINAPETDPRAVFADWLLAKGNPYFAKAFVNRMWHYFLGRGLIDPADDMPIEQGFWSNLFSGNGDPGNREILELLAEEFERSGYDVRNLVQLIMNSRAYRAKWETLPGEQAAAEKIFAVYNLRRLEAEVLVDAYSQVLRAHESYSSVIPEPFTFLPKNAPAVTIADGSISSRTLDNFGKPSRDSGTLAERNNAITPSQRLFLMNSNWIYQRANALPGVLFRNRRLNEKQRIEELYLTLLSRKPTPQEIKKIQTYAKKMPRKMRWKMWADLAWALINTREFLYHH